MARLVLSLLLALLFLLAGTIHLVDTNLFLPIMPPFIPFPRACVIVSGLAELAGGIGLLMPQPEIRLLTGWGLLLLLLAVFPANIYMAVHHVRIHGMPRHEWMAWARLPLQLVLVAAVVWVTGLVQRRRPRNS